MLFYEPLFLTVFPAVYAVYLLITVPLTHAINHIDRWTNRHSNPRAGGASATTRKQLKRQAAAARTSMTGQHN